MKWKHPSITKIYEALGAVADGRIEVSGNSAKAYSSTGNKFYTIDYDPDKKAIMCNDNSSFWQGTLGYPAIAFLMKKGVLSYDEGSARLLKGIAWKEVNQKFKNDFEKALDYILFTKTDQERKALKDLADKVDGELSVMPLSYLGKKTKPPEGY